ncbi:ROK family protein [Shouchella patagoniensis]|uniref:ROK family protein n=1 Tax=Shouchella patagoniensis TaxID=228576 RepID=UPI000994A9FD|nr:ROK family protein [Shouchella patagoniensis]
MGLYIAIDIGGTAIKHAVMDSDSKIIISGSELTPKSGTREIYKTIDFVCKTYMDDFSIEGLALSVPGALEPASGWMYTSGAVKDFQEVHLKEAFAYLNIPIEMENDANCVALAERWKGNAQGIDNFSCFIIGTGIGGAVFINGQLYRGVKGMAGEYGLMKRYFTTDQTDKNVNFGEFSAMGPLMRRVNSDRTEPIDGQTLFKLYKAGDTKIKNTVSTFLDSVAVSCANIIACYAPQRILVGGGVSEEEIFLAEVQKRVRNLDPLLADLSEIKRCHFQNQAGMVGALYHFLITRNIIKAN